MTHLVAVRRFGGVFGVVASLSCAPTGELPSAQRIMPSELADSAALSAMVDWSALAVFADGRYLQQSSEDRGRDDKQAIALWDNGNRDFNNFVCAGQQLDAPAARIPYQLDSERCAEGYVRGMVLSRFEGSGRLARLWLTAASIRSAPADRELLRVYVDDAAEPVVQVPLRDALDGSAGEMFAPPFGAGSQRRLAWYYPVVFGSKLIVSLDHLGANDQYFHQTAVVLDRVQRARKRNHRPLPARREAARTLQAGVPAAATPRSATLVLTSGAKRTLTLRGPATIVKARVRVAHRWLESLQHVGLSVNWDDAATAAIELPLSALFAAAAHRPEPASLALGSRLRDGDVELSLRLPMPFRERARWLLHNRGDEPVRLQLSLEVANGIPRAPFGNLHVQYNDTASAGPRTHPLARFDGRGRLAGVCMTMRGHGLTEGKRPGHPMHFLEGDEIGRVDGQRALGGTGTEDYFNGSFYFQDGASATPFAQVWGIERRLAGASNQARVSTCRWHVLGDTIDYQSSLELAMEVGPGVPAVLDRYRSVAFVYR